MHLECADVSRVRDAFEGNWAVCQKAHTSSAAKSICALERACCLVLESLKALVHAAPDHRPDTGNRDDSHQFWDSRAGALAQAIWPRTMAEEDKELLRCAFPTAKLFGPKSIGTRQPASVAKSSRSNTSFRHRAMAKSRLVICLDNSGYEVSLERRKIYVAVADAKAQKLGLLRVVDESGEDYLYPQEIFVETELPQSVRRAVLQAA